MLEELLMGLGALVWIVGELIAVKKGEDTTTSYVRRGRKWWIGRAAALAFTGWLFVHFNFGWV